MDENKATPDAEEETITYWEEVNGDVNEYIDGITGSLNQLENRLKHVTAAVKDAENDQNDNVVAELTPSQTPLLEALSRTRERMKVLYERTETLKNIIVM